MHDRPVSSRDRLRVSPRAIAIVLLLLTSFSGLMDLAAADDSYIAGYVVALLEREFKLAATIRVTDGVVTLYTSLITPGDRRKVLAALERIPGVVRAELVHSGITGPPPSAIGTTTVEKTVSQPRSEILPRGLLFEPLHADPRWPHFSAAYRSGTVGADTGRTFAGNFGETFALYRHAAPFNGQWEFGIQAGTFSIFDYGSASGSQDLLNTDYTIGLMASYRTGPFSGFVRLNHQSSHLGDEYILNSQVPVNRIGFSYEGVDVKLSYDMLDWLRVYGGAGYLLSTSPDNLKKWTSQFGIEFSCPRTFFGGIIRPVAYGDFQANERTNWSMGNSIMAGVQFEHLEIMDRHIQLLFEYYGGPSPNGDFYINHTEWFGIGLHFYL